jgi:hypothetical protein
MGVRRTCIYEKLLYRHYFEGRRNAINDTLNLEAQET